MYGAESVILQLMAAGRAVGDESTVAIFDNRSAPNEEFATAAERAGVRVERVVCRGQVDRRVPGRIREVARAVRAEVVHAHGYKADLYSWAGLRGLGVGMGRVGLVSTCHNWLDDGRAVRLYGRLDRWVLRRFDGVVAVSGGVERRLLASGVERVVLIPNGIGVERFRAARDGEGEGALVGMVARLSAEKGVDIFLRAAARVRELVPGARFVVWGEGPERAALEALRAELGLDGVVAMPGRQDDVAGALGRMDVLVLASRFEGLPMTLLEGMASGRAVVATAVGEVPTVLEDCRTGRLVPSEDAEAMARAVAELLGDAAGRRTMGMAAREVVERRFSAAAMARRYGAVYQQTLVPRMHASEARTAGERAGSRRGQA